MCISDNIATNDNRGAICMEAQVTGTSKTYSTVTWRMTKEDAKTKLADAVTIAKKPENYVL